MSPQRYTFASLLVLAVLLAMPPAAGVDPQARVVAWLTVTPDAVLPGETVQIRAAFDVSGGEVPTRLEVVGFGLAGYPILEESTEPACSRVNWVWTCHPSWPGRQSLDLRVRVPEDAPWATSHVFIFTVEHPGDSRWSVAESVWILGTRVDFDAKTFDGGNGTTRQELAVNVTGPGPATELWLSSAALAGVTIVSATPLPTQLELASASWFRENLTRGQYTFNVLMACPSGSCAAQATLQYADASGHVLPLQAILVPGSGPGAMIRSSESMAFVPLALFASGFSVFTVLIGAHWLGYEVLPTPERYRSPREVYVISKAGTLLAHRRRNGVPAKRDADILAGMFTAVREFARDAMGATETGTVMLSVGEERVTFVEGRQAVVALVGAGRIGRGTIAQADAELARLESVLGPQLDHWDGTSPELAEASESIADLLLR